MKFFAKPYLAWLVLALLLSGCGSSEPTPLPTNTPTATATGATIIVAMGDSLTEGLGVDPQDAYPAQLERKLQADGYQVKVINAGVSGETSSGALARLDWVLKLKPQIVILATGGNDSLRAIDPKVTQENLHQLIQKLQAEQITVVLAGMQTAQNLGEEYTKAFAAIYPAVAQTDHVILIPFFLAGVAGDPKLNQRDFIHPTVEGYQVVVQTIYPYVLEALKAAQHDRTS